jgi:hypothetical protein
MQLLHSANFACGKFSEVRIEPRSNTCGWIGLTSAALKGIIATPSDFLADGGDFAVYEFTGGRSLVVAERWGRASLVTSEEVRAEQESL